jgi:hypothetical protein
MRKRRKMTLLQQADEKSMVVAIIKIRSLLSENSQSLHQVLLNNFYRVLFFSLN